MKRKITIWRYLFSEELMNVVGNGAERMARTSFDLHPHVVFTRFHCSLCLFLSFCSVSHFLLCANHEKSFVFTHCFLLCQIHCVYRLKFIHINHIINTHLQCTKNFMQYLRSARVISTKAACALVRPCAWWRTHNDAHTQNMTKAMHAILNYSVRLP